LTCATGVPRCADPEAACSASHAATWAGGVEPRRQVVFS